MIKEAIIKKKLCRDCKHYLIWDGNITDCFMGRTVEHRKAQGGLTDCNFWESDMENRLKKDIKNCFKY